MGRLISGAELDGDLTPSIKGDVGPDRTDIGLMETRANTKINSCTGTHTPCQHQRRIPVIIRMGGLLVSDRADKLFDCNYVARLPCDALDEPDIKWNTRSVQVEDIGVISNE